jgi:hypothetical protein
MLFVAPVRAFFAIHLPPAAQAEEMTVIIAVAGFLLEVIYRILKDRAGLTEHIDEASS